MYEDSDTTCDLWKIVLKSAITLAIALLSVIVHLSLIKVNFLKLLGVGEIKAVLVAGSSQYIDYRHQADILHAYHVLRENGISEENIILMIHDDIAYNKNNPHKGVIINRPGGPNVYKNVKKDYTGNDVNKQVFFDVLLGRKEAVKGIGTGRVLESGPHDHVFVNYVDHGGPGILNMPRGYIKASELIHVLEKMANQSRFGKMFLFIEACQSGSMFDRLLPDTLNILAITASDPYENSYACFLDKDFDTYLGDLFSSKWMHDAETTNLKLESLNHQYQKVRSQTNRSHVQEYGAIDIGSTKLSEIIGYREQPQAAYQLKFTDVVSAHRVPIAILEHRIRKTKDPGEKASLQKKLHSTLHSRREVIKLFSTLEDELITPVSEFIYKQSIAKKPTLTKKNLACYENALTHLNECFDISQNPFVTSQLQIVISFCDVVSETEVMKKIRLLCQKKANITGIF